MTVGANLSGIINKKEYPSEGTWVNFYNILRALPTIPAVYPNGMIAPGRFAQNPLLLDRRGYKQIDETPLYTTFTGTYDLPFIEGLRLDASFNYDLDNHTDKTWQLPYMYNEYDVNTGEYNELITGPPSPILTDRYDKFTTMMFNFRLNYEVSLGDHNITAMVGQEQQKNKHSWIQAWRQNFVSSSIDQINAGSTAPEDRNNAGTTTESAYNNFFGRLNYDYRSKYLVEFLFRYDGSQIFPDGERYGFFPGVSAGWRLSEEPFIRDNLNFVDNLKLRFSHGKIGNDRVPQWQYLQAFTFVDNYVFGSSDVPGVRAGTLPNPGITWETSQKTDVGLEAEFIRGLIGMEATLWKENRSNILAARNLSIPHILGFPGLPDENIGEVDAKGFELIMTHQNTIDQIKYSISGNVAHASSKIVFMDETPNTEEYQNQTGKPVSSALYYKTDGIFNTQEELDSYPHRGSTQLGDLKIVDLNDDGVIDANDRYRHDKTATPEWVFGLNTSLTYQSFDLSVFFQGQAGAVNYATRFEDL
ncbi:MAG: SusC/RagA family TonB-linked outer membrane protein, partial [Marinoscillum sp.]